MKSISMSSAFALTLITTFLLSDAVNAQMFGNRRQQGRPLTRQAAPGLEQSLEGVGTLQGNERFLRGNRQATDFVGRDIRDLNRFIGLLQASIRNQATSATQDIRRRVDRSATMNQPLSPIVPRGQLYNPLIESLQSFDPAPQLGAAQPGMPPLEAGALDAAPAIELGPQLDVAVSFPEGQATLHTAASNALGTLVHSSQLSGSSRIAVSMEDRTATLRGEVPSAKDRDLAATLLTFEPGISAVRNELVVNPQLTPTADSLQALREQEQPGRKWITLSHGSTAATPTRSWDEVRSSSR